MQKFILSLFSVSFVFGQLMVATDAEKFIGLKFSSRDLLNYLFTIEKN